MIVLASEDIGMADPQAMAVAVAAAQAVEHVGLPEASFNLAQAVVYLATAPKSNAVAKALWAAQSDARERSFEVPPHLKDSDPALKRKLAREARGYRYSHDHPGEEQDFRPPELEGRRYWVPDEG
jgi:putative ATPase